MPIVMVLMVTVGWNITYTPTGSMEPTIKPWHIYRCVRWPFAPEPERGDIIMYRDGWRVYCKRLIGLPGDIVYIHDGIVETPDGVLEPAAARRGLRQMQTARTAHHLPEASTERIA